MILLVSQEEKWEKYGVNWPWLPTEKSAWFVYGIENKSNRSGGQKILTFADKNIHEVTPMIWFNHFFPYGKKVLCPIALEYEDTGYLKMV